MMKRLTFSCAVMAFCAAGLLMAGGAQAHGVWVAQRTGEWALVLGEGPVDDDYKAEAVKSVVGRTADGAPAPVPLRPQARNVVLQPGPEVAAVAASFEDGYWSQAADGSWKAGPRSQVPGARKAGYYMMYTTTVLHPAARPGALGLPLEIVPLADPLALKQGQTLSVRVLFEGKPLAGAPVRADYLGDTHGTAVKTDARGEARLRLRSSGLNVIKTSHARARVDRTEADEDGFSATLAFTLPQPKE